MESLQTTITHDVSHAIPESIGEVVLAPHKPTLYAEPLFSIGPLQVTNSLLTSWIAVLVIVVVVALLRLKLKKIPGRLQTVFEVMIDGGLSLCDQFTSDRKISIKIFPFVVSVFFFILIVNWMGIIPGIGSIGKLIMHDGHPTLVPYLRGGTADINTTLALSLIAVIGANIFGIISIGTWKVFNKFVNLRVLGSIVTKFKKDPTVIFVAPVTFFVGLIEIIGEIAKVASLSFRLFGNVFAGEVLLASMAAIFAFGVPIPFLFLEVLVGFIQALVFAMLTGVYFTIAAADHDEHEHEHEEVHLNKHQHENELVTI